MAAPKIGTAEALISGFLDTYEKFSEWAEEHDFARKLSNIVPVLGMLVVLSLVAAGIWVVWVVPQWQIERWPAFTLHGDPARQIELEDTLRKTLTQIVLGVFGLILLYFTWRRARAGDATVRIMEQGHITDRFTKAIDQLGALDSTGQPNIEVRLGAIYALERIALDSPRDHWSIMEILTAYVRQNAPKRSAAAAAGPELEGPLPGQSPEKPNKPRTDIQAILTVLGRRKHNRKRERPNHNLDLMNVWLRRAELGHSYLKRALLLRANLQGANLSRANLQGAFLMGADLKGADLAEASLQNAGLTEAKLQGAYLNKANLQDADLYGADLQGAVLNGANLRSRLRNANLQDASLRQADLQGADLIGANLQDADLALATLRRAKLFKADLRGAKGLDSAQVLSAAYWREAIYSDDMRKKLGLPDEAAPEQQ
jgi:uncharacterized protein YjbI with pentapeptide repeats